MVPQPTVLIYVCKKSIESYPLPLKANFVSGHQENTSAPYFKSVLALIQSISSLSHKRKINSSQKPSSYTTLLVSKRTAERLIKFNLKKPIQFNSVAQSCPTLFNPMNRSMPGLPVHHQLPGFTQTHVHRVGDAIQPSHPLSSPSPPAPNPSQHQSLFQ